VVANGIAEALITTALGLFVAIPAVVAYNAYGRKVERISKTWSFARRKSSISPEDASGRYAGPGKKHGPIVEINMIPLIDVSLVLLIIFMVMTPFLVQQQVRVNLPKSVAGHETPDRPIIVSIQRQGELSLNGKAVSISTLEAALKPLLGPGRERPVMIQADKDIPLQQVVSVMDIAKKLQVAKLGISVQPPR